jgi:hypothetical protein
MYSLQQFLLQEAEMKKTTFCITPLGAAVVEAMPDKAMVEKVNRDFKKYKMCPMSELFDFDAVKAFYHGDIIPMPQHLYRSKKKV